MLIERSNTPELVGTARLYRGPENWAIFPDLVIRARVIEAVSPVFMELVLQADAARKYFTERAQGTAGSMPKIDQGTIECLRVPVAPIAEQRRIVEKVEALLEQVNRAKERLDRVPLILKRFRQAVLAAACSGELTREWKGERESTEDLPPQWQWSSALRRAPLSGQTLANGGTRSGRRRRGHLGRPQPSGRRRQSFAGHP
jgi:type I restriction enzyme S subunit